MPSVSLVGACAGDVGVTVRCPRASGFYADLANMKKAAVCWCGQVYFLRGLDLCSNFLVEAPLLVAHRWYSNVIETTLRV